MNPIENLFKTFDCVFIKHIEEIMSINATVLWAGKDWPNKPEFGGGFRTSASFKLEDGTEVKVNTSKPDSPKGLFLKGLKKGDSIALEHNKARGDIPEFYDIDTWAIIGSGSGGSATPPGEKDQVGFMDDFAKTRKRAKWFQEQGIEVVREVATEAFGSEHAITSDTILERGGAIGTGMHMDMLAKGHR